MMDAVDSQAMSDVSALQYDMESSYHSPPDLRLTIISSSDDHFNLIGNVRRASTFDYAPSLPLMIQFAATHRFHRYPSSFLNLIKHKGTKIIRGQS